MILLFQILSVFLVLIVFQVFTKTTAGFIASSIFNLVAIYSIYYFYKAFAFKSMALYLWFFFFALFSLPIVLLRIYYFEANAADIQFLGISFENMHKSAERAYLFSFFAGLIDYIRIKKAANK